MFRYECLFCEHRGDNSFCAVAPDVFSDSEDYNDTQYNRSLITSVLNSSRISDWIIYNWFLKHCLEPIFDIVNNTIDKYDYVIETYDGAIDTYDVEEEQSAPTHNSLFEIESIVRLFLGDRFADLLSDEVIQAYSLFVKCVYDDYPDFLTSDFDGLVSSKTLFNLPEDLFDLVIRLLSQKIDLGLTHSTLESIYYQIFNDIFVVYLTPLLFIQEVNKLISLENSEFLCSHYIFSKEIALSVAICLLRSKNMYDNIPPS
jgi:hypothetical protein